jgi:glucokinase
LPIGPGEFLAIDIGGTKIATGVVSSDGSIRGVRTSQTPKGTDPERLYRRVLDLARSSLADAPAAIAACGVGCGGPMAPHGATVSPLNIPAWREFPLVERLESDLSLPTFADNDAKALALAEWWQGAAAGVANFLAMVVSTGVGGGIVLDGRLLDGRLGNAGHVGHVIVEPDGRLCGCGAHGCLEAEASGMAIEATTGRPPAEAEAPTRERTGRLVGRAVASVANLCDLDLVVIGGSVALGYGGSFFTAAQRELSARARLSYTKSCRIMPVGLGAHAPLFGAAAVAIRSTGIAEWPT